MLEYSETYKLRESDFDFKDRIRPSTYLDLFQTIAAKHATMLGLGFEPMLKKGIAWVVTKIKFDCFLPLHPGETVTVRTFPHPKGLIDYTRDFFMYNEQGELAAKGTSQWVHIDFKNRTVVKPTADFDGEFVNEYAYESKRIERIAPLDSAPVYTHTVTRSELDHNMHTNNIKYADMAYNATDLPDKPLSRIIINFLTESRLNDKIDISVKNESDEYLFTGVKDGKPCFTVKMTFSD